jgi:hypothetical protein
MWLPDARHDVLGRAVVDAASLDFLKRSGVSP